MKISADFVAKRPSIPFMGSEPKGENRRHFFAYWIYMLSPAYGRNVGVAD